jgi:replicative DNA helicase
MLSDLRESGSIEQDADIVIMLMRPSYYEMKEPVEIGGKEYHPDDLVIVKVEKNRHGKTGNIPIRFIGETTTFEDYNDKKLNIYDNLDDLMEENYKEYKQNK